MITNRCYDVVFRLVERLRDHTDVLIRSYVPHAEVSEDKIGSVDILKKPGWKRSQLALVVEEITNVMEVRNVFKEGFDILNGRRHLDVASAKE